MVVPRIQPPGYQIDGPSGYQLPLTISVLGLDTRPSWCSAISGDHSLTELEYDILKHPLSLQPTFRSTPVLNDVRHASNPGSLGMSTSGFGMW